MYFSCKCNVSEDISSCRYYEIRDEIENILAAWRYEIYLRVLKNVFNTNEIPGAKSFHKRHRIPWVPEVLVPQFPVSVMSLL